MFNMPITKMRSEWLAPESRTQSGAIGGRVSSPERRVDVAGLMDEMHKDDIRKKMIKEVALSMSPRRTHSQSRSYSQQTSLMQICPELYIQAIICDIRPIVRNFC